MNTEHMNNKDSNGKQREGAKHGTDERRETDALPDKSKVSADNTEKKQPSFQKRNLNEDETY